MGKYMNTPEGDSAGNLFYQIAFGDNPYYKHQGWLSGRVTTDDNFTLYRNPKLDKNTQPVPEGDYIEKPDFGMYYVSVDPSGRLGWENNILIYGTTKAHIIEVLTGKASNEYKAFLRKLEISYIIAGDDSLDLELAMKKLMNLFGIETLMLGGGGVLNWSFIQAGMCDELSIVMAPVADGSSDTPGLFATRGNLTADNPVGFELQNIEKQDSTLWLRYLVKRS